MHAGTAHTCIPTHERTHPYAHARLHSRPCTCLHVHTDTQAYMVPTPHISRKMHSHLPFILGSLKCDSNHHCRRVPVCLPECLPYLVALRSCLSLSLPSALQIADRMEATETEAKRKAVCIPFYLAIHSSTASCIIAVSTAPTESLTSCAGDTKSARSL